MVPPVLYQRIAAAKAVRPGMKVVNIDPRRTATSDLADMHLSIRGDGDIELFNGLLAHLAEQGAVDGAYVANMWMVSTPRWTPPATPTC